MIMLSCWQHLKKWKNINTQKNDVQQVIDYNYGLALHDVAYAAKAHEILQDNGQEITIERETAKFWDQTESGF